MLMHDCRYASVARGRSESESTSFQMKHVSAYPEAALVVQRISSGLAGAVPSDSTEDGVTLAADAVTGTRGVSAGLGGLDLCDAAVVAVEGWLVR